jgi:DNA-binding NarL/FixJ family response regulator
MALLTVLLADNYEPLRRILSSILEEMSDVKVIGEAADGLEAIQKTKQLHPDLIILDIGLPKLNGMQAARTILKAIPDSKIIFLSQETSTDFVDEALRLGALAYVIKVNAGTDLRRAIESVQKRKELTMSAAAQMREQSES